MQVHSVKKDSAKIFRLLRFSYSTAHEQLDRPCVSHASTRTRMRVYSHEYAYTHTRVLKHARAHARTHARDSRAVDTLASYPSPPLSFGVGKA